MSWARTWRLPAGSRGFPLPGVRAGWHAGGLAPLLSVPPAPVPRGIPPVFIQMGPCNNYRRINQFHMPGRSGFQINGCCTGNVKVLD